MTEQLKNLVINDSINTSAFIQVCHNTYLAVLVSKPDEDAPEVFRQQFEAALKDLSKDDLLAFHHSLSDNKTDNSLCHLGHIFPKILFNTESYVAAPQLKHFTSEHATSGVSISVDMPLRAFTQINHELECRRMDKFDSRYSGVEQTYDSINDENKKAILMMSADVTKIIQKKTERFHRVDNHNQFNCATAFSLVAIAESVSFLADKQLSNKKEILKELKVLVKQLKNHPDFKAFKIEELAFYQTLELTIAASKQFVSQWNKLHSRWSMFFTPSVKQDQITKKSDRLRDYADELRNLSSTKEIMKEFSQDEQNQLIERLKNKKIGSLVFIGKLLDENRKAFEGFHTPRLA